MEELAQSVYQVVPARAKFVGRFVGWTTFSSVSFGVFCGQIGAVLSVGPLMSFAGGAWLGYTFGCIGFMRGEIRRALSYIAQYPRLMEHAMHAEQLSEHNGFGQNESIAEWVKGGSGRLDRLGRLSWAVLAAQACNASVQEIQESQRAQIIESCTEPQEAM
eukprot:TRINITY_DN124176_c0_g1_i1.p1 TRINITY_DN124176_c0_g1~~TRINITY_DN124176_c0_g1_i1.p1  ORF type:complete len:161 (-),score=20.62 TRINITY_DN124176_c0_g1_i1:198-680(-)